VSKPKVFLSAVSGQFRNCRDALASDLRAIGAEVVVQDDFQQHGWTLLEKLQNKVVGCERVIALVGNAYGFEPSEPSWPPDRPRRSYTQWEYYFALGERLEGPSAPRIPIYVYFADETYLTAYAVEQEPELIDLQKKFIAAIRASNKDYLRFGSLDELRWKTLRDFVRVDEPGQPPVVTAFPTLVIGLSRRGDTYVFRAALRWWKGRHVEICKAREIAPHEGRRLTDQVEFALEFATKVFCERPPILSLVVELVLSEDLLLEPHDRWKDRWKVSTLSASPDVKRLIHEFWPVRLRLAKHWESGAIALKLASRVAGLTGSEELHGVVQDPGALGDPPDASPASRLWAIVQDQTAPAWDWWRQESVVCAAFTRRPQLVRRQVVARGWGRRAEPKPTPFLNAIDFGVPFIVWPNRQEVDRQRVSEHLEKCRRPAELCHYFYKIDPESFCVLDESCETPWPADEPRYESEVVLHPEDRP
jgi:hypothetical protein